MTKKLLFWILALIITLAAAIYQRKTGPTYPKEINLSIQNKKYTFSLPRSHGGDSDCIIKIPNSDSKLKGKYRYRPYPSNRQWITLPLIQLQDTLVAQLPHQPPAGKLEYEITLKKETLSYPSTPKPVIIRFKGHVPMAILLPHILFMFCAMLLSNLAGLLTLFHQKGYKTIAWATFFALLFGGMILGPVVQKYAFGELWTGIPFGWDLTDNKTLIAFLFWIIALSTNRKKKHPKMILIASIVTIIIFSIPHSMFGSQLDPNSGKIIQGTIIGL